MSIIPEEAIGRKVALAEDILGYTFHDKEVLIAALTHPSALEDEGVERSYERLEFLGDSLVGAFVAAAVFERYPRMDEGGMTRVKVQLVSGVSLSEVSRKLGLTEAIVFGGSETGTGKRGLHSALENVYESLVAALYLDGGLDAARAWVHETLVPLMSESMALEPENPKSSLQEVLQEHHVTPAYETLEVDGPPHDRRFTCAVMDGEQRLGTGIGRSKKEAEAAAAQDALDHMASR